MSTPANPTLRTTPRYRNRDERRQMVAAWRASGLTQSAFAGSQGVYRKAVSRWISSQRKERMRVGGRWAYFVRDDPAKGEARTAASA